MPKKNKKKKNNDVVFDNAIVDTELETSSITCKEEENFSDEELAKLSNDERFADYFGKYSPCSSKEDELNVELARIDDMNEYEFEGTEGSEDLDILAGASPNDTRDVDYEENLTNDELNDNPDVIMDANNKKDNRVSASNKSSKVWLKYLLLIIFMATVVVVGQRYLYYKYDYVPENRSEVHYLNGEKIDDKDIVIDVEYDVEMTDLDTGKTYMRKITYSDNTAPTITIDNGEYIFVKKDTNLVGGLTITDNYYKDLDITIEGINVSQEGIYNAIVKAVDGSNNSREVATVVKVVSDTYISNGIVITRNFDDYFKFRARLINPSANVDFKMFKDISFADTLKKIEDKEDFALFLHFDTCPWCQDAKPIIEKVAEELNITIYSIDTKKAFENCDKGACSLKGENVDDIRKTDDVDYVKWLATTQDVEYPTVPYMIVYKNGEKVGDFFNLEYPAHARNSNEDEIKEMTNIYTELLSKLNESGEE